MDAIIYTMDDHEFQTIRDILKEESNNIDIYRDPLDGHGHYEYAYDIVIVALEGAQGMEAVLEYCDRYPDSQIIWITSDKYFAGVALRNHIRDFMLRPVSEEKLRLALREAIKRSPHKNIWHYRVPDSTGGKDTV